jgi:hypothetical protein
MALKTWLISTKAVARESDSRPENLVMGIDGMAVASALLVDRTETFSKSNLV